MKAKSIFRDVVKRTTYFFVFIWTIISANAQCPTTVPSPPAICDAAGYTFADLTADYATDNGGGVVWYSAITGGTRFFSNQLVSEGTYYADDTLGSCSGSRASTIIDFQVNKSGLNLDRFYCSNENATFQIYEDLVLAASIPPGGSVEVYYDQGLTSPTNSGDPIPLGVADYYIVFVNSSLCRSQIEVGRIGVFVSPADPTPPSTQEFCIDTNPTVGSINPGTAASVKWYQGVDSFGNPIPPALALATPLVDGSTYYVQVDELLCDSNAVPVTVTINIPLDPGTSGSLEYCQDNVPASDFNLLDELGGSPNATGTWTGPLSTTGGNLGTVNISTLTTPGVYTFTYTVPANGACPASSSNVSITIFESFSSGTVSSQSPATFCESSLPSAFDLATLLDNEDPNGQWTQGTLSTDPVVTSPIDLSSFTNGVYNFTYTQNLLPNPCAEESTTVQVIILQDPNAGVAVNQTFCENDLTGNSPFDLFNALDGSQDNNGGIWTDSSALTISNSLDITVFTVAGSPYSFNYTIDNGTCSDTETITITIEPAPESGNALAPIEICEEDTIANSPFDLFTLLDGTQDTNGTWYVGSDTSGATITNPIDISGFADGTYDYTYSVPAIGSCTDVDVTVQIIINPQPVTGIPTAAIFCENDLIANSPLDLFGQLSGNELGGTWADDNSTGALTGSNVDITGLAVGSYNFTYSITTLDGCSNSSTVVITIEPAPESGNALAPIEICEEDTIASSPFDLFTLLDGTQDTNGTWYVGSDTSGATITNPIDISGFADGTYNYTYSVPAIGTCTDVDVTVQIIVNPQPNTGVPTAVVLCENDLAANSPLDLFGQLSGNEPGGSWTDDNTTGALTGSDVDLTLLTIGSYNFSYSISSIDGCTNSSTVIVTVEDAPESGTPVATFPEYCKASVSSGQTVNLFDLLIGEDQTGTWADDDASGALTGNLVNIDGLAAGTYNFTYDVTAVGTCDDVLVTVSVIINDTPAPTASITQEFCDSATVSDLSATGTTIQWYDDVTGGTALAGTVSLIDGETYYATQIDATNGCESSVRFEVTATIYQSPNSGNPAAPIISCNNINSIDLFSGLDGTQDAGGVWQDTDGTGALTGNIFDASGMTPGNYQFTYYVTANAPCIDTSTTITVTIDPPLNAGTDAIFNVCSDDVTTDLFTLLGSADTGGTWSPALTSGTGVFDPLADASGTYTYTLSNGCGIVSSDVIVTVTQAPDAGVDNTISICVIDGTLDLFTQLGGTPDTGGTWSPALSGGTGVFDPAIDASGVYTYFVASVLPCRADASATVTVTVNDSSAPTVLDSNPTFCLVDNPTVADLNNSLTATGTIIWYSDAAQTNVLNSTDALVNGQDYFATQTNNTGCESSQNVQVSVTVNDVSTPTFVNPNQELCINDGPTIMDLTLNIAEYNSSANNVLWYDNDTGGSTISSSTTLSPGTTYHAVLYDAATGCESSVRLAVTPDLTSCGKIDLPDGFSPNGDGVNDTYDYNNIDIIYPNFEIEIYNRYGNIVYKGRANSPRFDGTSNQARTVVKGDLPVGVYFYIFNFNDGETKPEQGRLYLSR